MAARDLKRRGILLVLSSPSGAGKTTITRALVKRDRNLKLSVSATTRPRRPGELDGKHYHFVTRKKFAAMVRNGALLEHARVFGHQYGTPRAPVARALDRGVDVICDVDWQGTKKMKARLPKDLVSVFILPPSLAALERRLKRRAQDSRDVVRARMAMSAKEMSHYEDYDYIVVNRLLPASIAQVAAILAAERLRRRRQRGLDKFVNRLRRG